MKHDQVERPTARSPTRRRPASARARRSRADAGPAAPGPRLKARAGERRKFGHRVGLTLETGRSRTRTAGHSRPTRRQSGKVGNCRPSWTAVARFGHRRQTALSPTAAEPRPIIAGTHNRQQHWAAAQARPSTIRSPRDRPLAVRPAPGPDPLRRRSSRADRSPRGRCHADSRA